LYIIFNYPTDTVIRAHGCYRKNTSCAGGRLPRPLCSWLRPDVRRQTSDTLIA